jgi:hypothetical protein
MNQLRASGYIAVLKWFSRDIFEERAFSLGITVALQVGRDSSAGIATGYWLEGPGIEPGGGGARFTSHSRTTLGHTHLLYSGYRVFTGGKAVGAWRCPSTSSAEVKKG